MRQRNVKNCDEILNSSDKYLKDIHSIDKSKYEKICLEIGIGKGAFISECAKRHPENLYIGIELNKGVVSLATKKIARFETEIGKKLDNLKVLDYNALELNNLFEAHEVDKIYLNFSDPWPKKKHEKRRLTSDEFLKVYKSILKEDSREKILMGDFNLKTNKPLFLDFIESLEEIGMVRVPLDEKTLKQSRYSREIDHIFISSKFKLKNKQVIKDLDISDHYPVIVELEVE